MLNFNSRSKWQGEIERSFCFRVLLRWQYLVNEVGTIIQEYTGVVVSVGFRQSGRPATSTSPLVNVLTRLGRRQDIINCRPFDLM